MEVIFSSGVLTGLAWLNFSAGTISSCHCDQHRFGGFCFRAHLHEGKSFGLAVTLSMMSWQLTTLPIAE